MSGPTVPPSGGTSRQPWTSGQAAKGVTCPACGLANEGGVRTCRNCGLPIASASDPLRGVAPGHVDLPRARRSGLSTTVGFVMVIALLLIGGTLAVSGGGILSTGGRLGATVESPSPSVDAGNAVSGEDDLPLVDGTADGSEPVATEPPTGLTTSFEYTCEDDAIKDLSKGRWFVSEVQAGSRPESDQIYWNMTREKAGAKKGTVVTMEWMTPKAAQKRYGIPKVSGDRALLITFDGRVDITANQTIDSAQLEAEGIDQVRRIQLFEGKDKKVRTAIGVSGESCAKMTAKNWSKKNKKPNGRVSLDIERFDP